MPRTFTYPHLPKIYVKGDTIEFPQGYGFQEFQFTKFIRKMKIELWGNIAFYGSTCKGGYVYGEMEYRKLNGKSIYVFNPPSSYQGGRNGINITPHGPWVVACARVSNDVRTDPNDLYSRFIAAGGAGGEGGGANPYASNGAAGGGWTGWGEGDRGNGPNPQGYCATPGTQSHGGTGDNARGYFGYAGDDDGWARFDNSGGGWYGGGEAGRGGDYDFAAGGSSYVSGDNNCNGTQTNATWADGSQLRFIEGTTGTQTGISGGCRCLFIVTQPGFEQNTDFDLFVRKSSGEVIRIMLFFPPEDQESFQALKDDPDTGLLWIRDPKGRLCFALSYKYRENDYGYLRYREDGVDWFVSTSY